MSKRNQFALDQIAHLKMQIRTNEFNLQRQGPQQGYNQLAASTNILRYQLASWENDLAPKKAPKPRSAVAAPASKPKPVRAAMKAAPVRKP